MEGVGILAGLCQENVGLSHTEISSNILHHTSHRNGRILCRFHKDFANHGGGGGFSVGTGHVNSRSIILHDASQKICTSHHGNASALNLLKLLVILGDGGSINTKFYSILNILTALGNKDLDSQAFQVLSQRRGLGIRSGHGKMTIQQNFCQAAHGDSPYSDKVHPKWFVKMNIVHISS